MDKKKMTDQEKILLAKAITVKERELALKDYKTYSSKYLWITDKKGDKIKLKRLS